MNDIKVYHSIWKTLLIIIISFAFTAGGIWIRHEHRFVAWLTILFFGGGGLFTFYVMLKERVTKRPYLIITDKSVTMTGAFNKTWEILFSDVTSFFPIKIRSAKMIGIKYKKNVADKKMDESNKVGKAIRKMNMNIAQTQETIQASGMTIKPQQLLDLLNERLSTSQENNA